MVARTWAQFGDRRLRFRVAVGGAERDSVVEVVVVVDSCQDLLSWNTRGEKG